MPATAWSPRTTTVSSCDHARNGPAHRPAADLAGQWGSGFRPTTKSGCVRPPRADAYRVRGAATPGFGARRDCRRPLRLRARALRRTARPRQCLGSSGRGSAIAHYTTLPARQIWPTESAYSGQRDSDCERTCPSPGRRSLGTVGPRISAVDEIRMRPPPEGGRIPRPRGGHTRIWSATGLPHPPSSPRSRAPTNGPAEAMPRLVGPRPLGPLRSEADDVPETTAAPVPPLSCSVTGSLTRERIYSNINDLTLVARVRQGHVSRGRLT